MRKSRFSFLANKKSPRSNVHVLRRVSACHSFNICQQISTVLVKVNWLNTTKNFRANFLSTTVLASREKCHSYQGRCSYMFPQHGYRQKLIFFFFTTISVRGMHILSCINYATTFQIQWYFGMNKKKEITLKTLLSLFNNQVLLIHFVNYQFQIITLRSPIYQFDSNIH